MTFGRRLGIDYGKARVGIAICDRDGLVVTPVQTLKNDGKILSQIAELIREYEPVGIYLGKPKHLAGLDGSSVEMVAVFAEQLVNSFNLPITYVDERLTSSHAEKLLKAAGKSSRESRGLIDQLAAVAILELGIDIEKHGKSAQN